MLVGNGERAAVIVGDENGEQLRFRRARVLGEGWIAPGGSNYVCPAS
jgi:hypothetical protein